MSMKIFGSGSVFPHDPADDHKYTIGSWNDLSDKPFGEESVILFDQTVKLVGGETVLDRRLPIIDGDHVTVTIDNVKYETIANLDATGSELFVQHGDEENPDFIIVVSASEYDDPYTAIVVPNKTSASVKIEKMQTTTIDPKYLPIDYLKQLIVEQTK